MPLHPAFTVNRPHRSRGWNYPVPLGRALLSHRSMKNPFGQRILVPALVLTTVLGWGWAFTLKARFSSGVDPGGKNAGPAVRNQSRPADRSTSTLALSGLASSSRSAKLFAHLAEISADAMTGKPNEALLAACVQTLQDPDYVRRSRDFSLLLELMRPEDAIRIHEDFIAMDRAGKGFGEEYGAFATRWGEVDPQGALAYFLTEDPVRLPPQDMEKIARSWGQADPAAALKWMDEHPDIAASRGGWGSAIKGWFRTDPNAATNYLFSHDVPPQQIVDTVRYALVEKLFDGGLDDATHWLAGLPEHPLSEAAAAYAWNNSVGRLGALSPDNAASAWSRLADQPWMDFRQFTSFTNMVGRSSGNPDGIPGYLDALQNQWPADRAVEKFKVWYHADEAGVTQWLNNSPDTDYTRAIREAVISK